MQKSQGENKAFEAGTWGVEIFEGLEPSVENGDVVVSKHWSSRCGFFYLFLFVDILWENGRRNADELKVRSRIRIWTINFDRGTLQIW